MLRINDIQEKFLNLVGWKQSYDTSDIMLSEELTLSESGIYFQQTHPLLTLQNLACVSPDFSNISYPLYDSDKLYAKGQIVSDSTGKLYRSNKANRAESLSNAEFWTETNVFSEWVREKTISSIQKILTRFVSEKIIKGTHKQLCENKTLFDGTGRITDKIPNRNNLVGFELVPVRSQGVTVKINRIGLQFTKPGAYNIYIFHSSNTQPIYANTIIKFKENTIEWLNLKDCYLPYKSDSIDSGGSWFICYAQSELPEESQAIKKDKDWSKKPCQECSRNEYSSWKAWSKYLEVHPFYVNEELVHKTSTTFSNNFNLDFNKVKSIPELWDIGNNQYLYDTNFGLNLDISVLCDETDFFIEQRMIFADLIAKQVAVDMLREFAYNPNVRTNRHSINASRVDILYELDGDSSSMKKSGLSYQLELALSATSLSLEGIDRVCLPCNNHGIKYRTV